jgi:cell division protein FtsB
VARHSKAAQALENRLLRWVIIGLTLSAAINLSRLMVQEWRLLRQGQILRQEQMLVEARAQEVESEIRLSKAAPGIQRLARERLGFGMPGEVPVHFTGKIPPTEAVPIPIP